MYLLDTDVVSELRKPPSRIDPRVAAWRDGQDALQLHLSAITVFELEMGVVRVERRDARQGANLRSWLVGVLDVFAGRVLPFDLVVASRAARLQVPDPRSDHDCFIAATALVHGMTVVTRNTRDFEPTGVKLIDPWQFGEPPTT